MKPKGRPKKKRIVKSPPKIGQFSPRGKPGRPEEVELTIDQYEAVRLSEYKALEQVDAAESMGISRQTFGRILKDARKKIADGLINEKIIRIQGKA